MSSIITLSVLGLVLAIAIILFIPFLFANYYAVKYNKDVVDLLGGWVKFVLWKRNEGIIILKNKKLIFSDSNGEGGTKYILPILGEEFLLKVPLNIQMLTWEDDKILTRESLQIHMKVAVWWNVSDIVKYVFDISQSTHLDEKRKEMSLLQSSEAWLMTLTESTIRVLASKASATQLITSATTAYLNVHHTNDEKKEEFERVQTISETIANNLHGELNKKLLLYGININRVEIQAIRLSSEVQEAINKVWLSFLKPVQSEQEARALQIELEGTARVLGVETTALIEVLKSYKGSGFQYQPLPFVQTMSGMIDTRLQNITNPKLSTSQNNDSGDKQLNEDTK